MARPVCWFCFGDSIPTCDVHPCSRTTKSKMATEQYENTPVNNVQARMRAVADTPDGSDVEIASEDREARDGREYRSNMTNKTAVKDIDEQHLSSEDEEEREEQGDSYKDSQMRGPPCAISIVPLLTFL